MLTMRDFTLTVAVEKAAVVEKGGKPLFALCYDEAQAFSDYLAKYSADSKEADAFMYSEGLSDWEMRAVAGYLYQKARGRL